MSSAFLKIAEGVHGYAMVGRDIVGAQQLADMAVWTVTKALDRIHPKIGDRGDAFDDEIVRRLHEATKTILQASKELEFVVNALELEAAGDKVEARNALVRALYAHQQTKGGGRVRVRGSW